MLVATTDPAGRGLSLVGFDIETDWAGPARGRRAVRGLRLLADVDLHPARADHEDAQAVQAMGFLVLMPLQFG